MGRTKIYIYLLIVSIIINYFFGILIERHDSNRNTKKNILALAVLINISVLIFFKYLNFIVHNLNLILEKLNLEKIIMEPIALPLGISFLTFRIISYLVDTYRKNNEAQKNFIDLALYISLFPPLTAGPIVRYNEIATQIKNRITKLEDFEYGIKRFIIGLAKKVIIANTLGSISDKVFALSEGDLKAGVAWIGIICYTLQIYHDFSGYSDMAIGLGQMFGFKFLENFNYPYISKSIKEFWRRWHISLSSWFRDYVYIPLGGNRVGKFNQYRNLIIVFFCTGIWHGASWNFIIWGLYHGVFLILERTKFSTYLKKMWKPIQSLYVLLVVMIGWVFFKAENLSAALIYLKSMIYWNINDLGLGEVLAMINNEVVLIIIIAIIIATDWPKRVLDKILRFFGNQENRLFILAFDTVKKFCLIAIFILSIMALASSTYSPFIYFKF